MIKQLSRRITGIVSRGVVKIVKLGGSRQVLQLGLLAAELRDDVERMQNYGFCSVPKPGADAAVIFVGGSRSKGIAVVVDDRRYQIELAEGEVAIFDDLGNKIELKRDKVKVTGVSLVEIAAPQLTINATTTITGNVTINGNITSTGTVTNNSKNIGSTHTHSGVTSGGGITGVPT